MTPLHWAPRSNSLRCLKWLLRRGAAVNAATVADRTPLHLAAERGNVEAVWLLAEHGADLDAQDRKGRTPLHRAAYEGRLEAAEALIVLGGRQEADDEIRQEAAAGGAAGLPAPEGGVVPEPTAHGGLIQVLPQLPTKSRSAPASTSSGIRSACFVRSAAPNNSRV